MKDLDTIRRSHALQQLPKIALLSLLLYGASVSGLLGSFGACVAVAQRLTESISSPMPMTSVAAPLTNSTELPASGSGSPVSAPQRNDFINMPPMAATSEGRATLDSSDIYVDATTDRLDSSNRAAATATTARPPQDDCKGCELHVIRAAAATTARPPQDGLISASADTFTGRTTPIGKDYANRLIRFPQRIPTGNLGLLFPLSIPAAITSAFGWRVHPLTGDRRFHSGTDLGAPMGTPVLAAYAGQVAFADFLGGYGLAIAINHNQGTQQTLYGHLSEIFVKPGDLVKQGTAIGRVGSTGVSTGPHLHFEFRQLTTEGWVAMDPGEQLEYALGQLIKRLQVAQSQTKAQANVGT